MPPRHSARRHADNHLLLCHDALPDFSPTLIGLYAVLSVFVVVVTLLDLPQPSHYPKQGIWLGSSVRMREE